MSWAEEIAPPGGVGVGAGLRDDAVVIHQEFALQDAQTVEFIEKVRGSLEGVRQRFLGMDRDIAIEQPMGGGEIETVQPVEGLVERNRVGGQRGKTQDSGE